MMVHLSKEQLRQVVTQANLAPSVHNTQPTRWRLDDKGGLHLSLEPRRLLKIGDPKQRDARLSCGTALEGTRLALSELGFSVASITKGQGNDIARLELGQMDKPDPISRQVTQRATWRGGFAPAKSSTRIALAKLCKLHSDVTLASEPEEIEMLASLNDKTSLNFIRDRAFRKELLSWMRLSPSHEMWARDGMNADALLMGRIEAFGAGIVLQSPVFDLINAVGLSSVLMSERSKTMSSTAIALFHRPNDEDPLDSGIALYRFWLNLTQAGFSAWPMAAIADNPDTRAQTARQYKLPCDHRLINLLRVGIPSIPNPLCRARLDPQDLIKTAVDTAQRQ